MNLIPNIFGDNDRYIGILPLSYWVYQLWLKSSILNWVIIILGVSSIIGQVYRGIIDSELQKGHIRSTRDFSNFILKNPLLIISGFILLFYYPFTVIHGLLTKKDLILYSLLVVNIVGLIYIIFTFILRKDFRVKIKQVRNFLMKKRKLLRKA